MIIQPMHSLSHSPYSNPWVTRFVTLLLAALSAFSMSYWVLHWPAPSKPIQMGAREPAARPIDTNKVAQLLGASRAAGAGNMAPAASQESNYKLLGVIAVGHRNGSALISAYGKNAKPFRVGDHVSDDLVLQAVDARAAYLSPSLIEAATVMLELAPPTSARSTH
jgi:hypothetical protein